jgi:hypothetical protein
VASSLLGVWSYGRIAEQLGSEARAAAIANDVAMRRPPRSLVPGMESARVEPISADVGMFHGISDDLLLEPLRTSPIASVKANRGGSSVSLRVELANGARAAFKPHQTMRQSMPRKEVAAFRINRLLGLSSVQPAIGRKFRVDEVLGNLRPDSVPLRPRLMAEMIQEEGWVTGALSWWIPVIKDGKVGRYDIDSTEGVVTWKRYLTVGESIPHEDRDLVAQISNVLLFDFLINNVDRWSGGNAKVSEDGRTLYFMDNTMSFAEKPRGLEKVRSYLQRSQKFSRALVAAARQLTAERVREVLERDRGPFDLLLTEGEIDALMARRDFALRYIDDLIAVHGESAVLEFP